MSNAAFASRAVERLRLGEALVAVYGTLRLGEYNWRAYLPNAPHLGTLRATGYQLHTDGRLPYVAADVAGEITVDVFAADAPTLKALDILEGVPDDYRREPIVIEGQPCWIYVAAALDPAWRKIPSGDWVAWVRDVDKNP